ncbi:hypothetical protein QUF80_13900 [Desulfococcaceae bacterium HSG8]|nr:hypothetical protein [Desulfococcaceae bacterium HSG8]
MNDTADITFNLSGSAQTDLVIYDENDHPVAALLKKELTRSDKTA